MTTSPIQVQKFGLAAVSRRLDSEVPFDRFMDLGAGIPGKDLDDRVRHPSDRFAIRRVPGAAAVAGRAAHIVTHKLPIFSATRLAEHGVTVTGPDTYCQTRLRSLILNIGIFPIISASRGGPGGGDEFGELHRRWFCWDREGEARAHDSNPIRCRPDTDCIDLE
jgi:hypothetical protein